MNKKTYLQKQIEIAEENLKGLRELRQQEKANQKFRCECCGGLHKIKDCDAIEDHYYVRPSGCFDGDYWTYNELRVVCPKTGMHNRFLYTKTSIEWNSYNGSAEQQFNRHYRSLFKSITKGYGGYNVEWRNNYYVDQHRDKFEIKIGE